MTLLPEINPSKNQHLAALSPPFSIHRGATQAQGGAQLAVEAGLALLDRTTAMDNPGSD